MKRKIEMLVLWTILSFLMIIVIIISEKYKFTIGAVLAGALIALFIEKVRAAVLDIFDTTNWKSSQTKLKRGGFIKDDTIIRISFAYLYRIKVENKYFLIQNSRNTGKYQPVGGV